MNILKDAARLKIFLSGLVLMLLSFSACSTLILKQTDFAWPIESVLTTDEDGFVKEERHNIIFDTKELFLAETEDSTSYLNKDIRVITDTKGFVYVTSQNFKNVYVFEYGEGELILKNKIRISETESLREPAFNQRLPYIELLDGEQKYLLTNEGIKEDNEK
jgi:thioredoxin-related protein